MSRSSFVIHGDARALPLPAGSVDAVVCDPPYGLEFMGAEWDRPWAVGFSRPGYRDAERTPRPSYGDNRNPTCTGCGGRARGVRRCRCSEPQWNTGGNPASDMRAYQAWCESWARELLRVLKPGGWLLAFGGTRTWHRLVCGVEDAGFEIRDDLMRFWCYGQGFPKSLDVSKAIDKAAGVEREVVGERVSAYGTDTVTGGRVPRAGGGAGLWGGPDAKVVSLTGGPATPEAAAWEGWGTALKPAWEPIVVARKPLAGTVAQNVLEHGTGALNIDGCRVGKDVQRAEQVGRWPANVVLDEEAAAILDAETGTLPVAGGFPAARQADKFRQVYSGYQGNVTGRAGHVDLGTRPSRFFYTTKADADERVVLDGEGHPTVKPLELVRWLVRLVCRKGGLILDPFCGSGTTGEAAMLEGMRSVLVDNDPKSCAKAVIRTDPFVRRRNAVRRPDGRVEDADSQLRLL